MSIRFRLTLLYGAIVALTLVLFSAALYLTVSQVSESTLQRTLADEAGRLLEGPDFHLDRVDSPAAHVAAPETYIQTRTREGAFLSQSPNLNGFVLPLSAAGTQAVQSGKSWTEPVTAESGRLLVLSLPATPRGQTTGILQVARSLGPQDQSLTTLKQILLAGSLLATLVASLTGWLLAGAALRPIDRITHTAEAIGAEQDFARRVSYRGPPDEVGRLARTLNGMLQELGAVHARVQESLEAQRRFVADASHELRTPLTTIRGNLGLLQREPPIRPEDRVAALEDTAEECDRLIRLVNNLLVLARADSGVVLPCRPVAVGPLLQELHRQAKLLAPDHRVACETAAGVTVLGDADALKQILLILIDNARKFTPRGGRIALRAITGESTVTISVQDEGAGIAPLNLPHIFDRFFQADQARSDSSAGLGLAIARQLTEAQGGEIHVVSTAGRGSTFSVCLPLHGEKALAAALAGAA